jgi:hypothetical protein
MQSFYFGLELFQFYISNCLFGDVSNFEFCNNHRSRFYINFILEAAYSMASTACNKSARVCNDEMLILTLEEPFLTVGNLIGWTKMPFLIKSLEKCIASLSGPTNIGMI